MLACARILRRRMFSETRAVTLIRLALPRRENLVHVTGDVVGGDTCASGHVRGVYGCVALAVHRRLCDVSFVSMIRGTILKVRDTTASEVLTVDLKKMLLL